jgi:ATP-dependent DNA helicase DinG
MKSSERFEPEAAQRIREAIREAAGNEVLAVGRLGGQGRVEEVTVAARGHEEAVPVLEPFVQKGDVVIHNHPSGRLRPSSADLSIASRLGADGVGFFIVDNEVDAVYVVAEPVARRGLQPLDAGELAGHLEAGGSLSRLLPEYEERPSQVQMLKRVCAAFSDGRLLIAEAGTGVGKSLAYLIPAFAWVLQNEERVVVSTATINLQQQLIDQDVPLVRRIFGRDPGVALVKGRGNYLCLTRLEESIREFSLFEEEDREVRDLYEWSRSTPSGSRSDFPVHIPDDVWQRVCSEADACRGLRCPERERCFVLRSRREAAAARLLIVNHHLLFSDLSLRATGAGFDGSAVLPPFQRIIFDEAHNIENSATSYFTTGFSRLTVGKYAGRLYRRKKGRAFGLLLGLEKLAGPGEAIARIRQVLDEVQEKAQTLETLALRLAGEESGARLQPKRPHPQLEALLLEPVGELSRTIRSLVQLFQEVFERLSETERESGLVYECQIELRRLAGVAETGEQFLRYEESPRKIFWMETQKSFRGERYLRFMVTPLDIAELMNDAVFRPYATVIFTSATLAVNRGFGFWKSRVGLLQPGSAAEEGAGEETGPGGIAPDRLRPPQTASPQAASPQAARGRECEEGIFPSPFDYPNRVLLGVPEDAPGPEEEGYPAFLARAVRELLKISGGRALVLFTSYSSLNETYAQVLPLLEEMGIPTYRQGDDDRSRLLARFRQETDSVLFATDSFWEGVDAPGEALEMVLLCRLPFRVPSEPIVAARMEAIEERGGNPFIELSLPDAVMRLKQGFGRLMRKKSDWGAVLILDSRVARRFYGKVFLASLPEARRAIVPGYFLLEEVRDFYGRMRKKEEHG